MIFASKSASESLSGQRSDGRFFCSGIGGEYAAGGVWRVDFGAVGGSGEGVADRRSAERIVTNRSHGEAAVAGRDGFRNYSKIKGAAHGRV